MTPLGWTCEHRCCADDAKPHAHLTDPETCEACKTLAPSERAAELEQRALRIGGTRHPELNNKENNDAEHIEDRSDGAPRRHGR